MDTRLDKEKAEQWVSKNSGLDDHLAYLGMSTIGRCPRWLYDNFVSGRGPASVRAHLNCISGYMHEKKMLEILIGAGICSPVFGQTTREIVADFDTRFRGHVDGWTVDHNLIEIKSMGADDFRRFQRTRELDRNYLWQIQAYMRYGRSNQTLLVAVCRDPFMFWFDNIARDDLIGVGIEAKAKYMLAAIDHHDPPSCECGRCGAGGPEASPQSHAARAPIQRDYARPVSSRGA